MAIVGRLPKQDRKNLSGEIMVDHVNGRHVSNGFWHRKPAGETVGNLSLLTQRRRKYRCIYADPPWRYDQTPRGAAAYHYSTMSLVDILALPVAKLADVNCQLHLWTPHSLYMEARQIMESWQFEYRSCFVWLKPTIGAGHYWRVATEFLLFGIKGNAPFRDQSIPNWICVERGEHSDKPDQVRELVELVSDGPRLELFGRRAQRHWTVFGNEIQYGLFDSDIVRLGENSKDQ